MLAACSDSGGGGTTPNPPNPPAVNAPPTANAGADQTVEVAANVGLDGSASSDTDGTIASFAWTQTGGTDVTLAGANTATATFVAPDAAATLTFELSVTDNVGATRSDSVTVNVNAPPVANAGADRTVNVGAEVTLDGSASSDTNGTIASYAWTQTAGASITLTAANTTMPTFTAPGTAAALIFELAVTDDQGASHTDTVTISVNPLAVPTIVRQPTSPRAAENGSALLFVVASGEDLTYEWRRNNSLGSVVKSGPEPFLLIAPFSGLGSGEDGDCYVAVVSNGAGSATSEPGCLSVTEMLSGFDPGDENLDDDVALAEVYGNTLLRIARYAGGILTGGTVLGTSGVPSLVAPSFACNYSGEFLGATIDGVAVAATTQLPLGRHTVSLIWDECRPSSDHTLPQIGGMLITYDFPTVFGEGSFTLHISGYAPASSGGYVEGPMNGTLDVTVASGVDGNGHRVDDISVVIGEDLTVPGLRQLSSSSDTIALHRTFSADELLIEQVTLDFDASMGAYSADGFEGTAFKKNHADLDLNFDPNEEPNHTSDGVVLVGLSGHTLGTLFFETAGAADWVFAGVPDEGCPEGQTCVDLPPPP